MNLFLLLEKTRHNNALATKLFLSITPLTDKSMEQDFLSKEIIDRFKEKTHATAYFSDTKQ